MSRQHDPWVRVVHKIVFGGVGIVIEQRENEPSPRVHKYEIMTYKKYVVVDNNILSQLLYRGVYHSLPCVKSTSYTVLSCHYSC
jgi:hypothetical protein